MGRLRLQIAISLDGFVAGPDQSVENPIGVGGMALHEWMFGLQAWRRPHGKEGGEVNQSTPVVEQALRNIGASVMGRNMFGGGPGPWGSPPWQGWWGEEPPFRHPVFVLTHHAREPLVKGATTFHFVTEGIEAALERARAAAAGRDVALAGGADVARQYLSADLVDEMLLHVAPLLLGEGERLFEGIGSDLRLETLEVVAAPGVTHMRFAVRSGAR